MNRLLRLVGAALILLSGPIAVLVLACVLEHGALHEKAPDHKDVVDKADRP